VPGSVYRVYFSSGGTEVRHGRAAPLSSAGIMVLIAFVRSDAARRAHIFSCLHFYLLGRRSLALTLRPGPEQDGSESRHFDLLLICSFPRPIVVGLRLSRRVRCLALCIALCFPGLFVRPGLMRPESSWRSIHVASLRPRRRAIQISGGISFKRRRYPRCKRGNDEATGNFRAET
jgi:hypothetical protein